MFSYLFGYNEDTHSVLKDEDVKKINILAGECQSEEDKDFMYLSHSKNYELNKQIRRIATKIKLNKTIPNVYIEDDSYLDHVKPIHHKRILKHHKRNDSLESVYEVIHRLAEHEKLIDETNNDMYGTLPTKKNRKR